ncbi:uncharacterized protein LOC142221976 [Haematobia irritans]|uniref:uncharacterized protein LOC142221976 n=1 Tax=Haematobia irritans TaxID=7368 RepID=UPI003F509B28
MISERFIKVLIVLFGIALKFLNCYGDVGLPLIQISHDDDDFGDDYPELREEVHLEDFFWTGSGDGPPDYLKQVHTGISKGKDVVVKTETVVATVYVDGNNEVDIPICLDCYGEGTVGIDGTWTGPGMPPLNYSATDRRYWLLTVMSGFYTQKDYPMLEEKLARLYRLAFTRQQTKHLGINGAQQISGISLTAGRDRRHNKNAQDAENVTTIKEPPDYDVELLDMAVNNTSKNDHHLPSSSTYPINTKSELITSSEENMTETTTLSYQYSDTDIQAESSDIIAAHSTPAPWELIQENAPKLEKQIMAPLVLPQTVRVLQPQPRPQPTQSPPSLLPPLSIRDNQVRVVIHNITQLTEEDVERSNADGDSGTFGGVSGIYDGDINDRIDERPIANQTELIYSVFVNGRPVLAVTAANDMKLVSESEVATVMGKEIFMKAEPYMREPQATPLAPATHSGSVGFIDSIQNNTVLIVVSSIAILLLFLLLIALLLMGRSHVRHKNQEINRTTSRNELISEVQSVRPTSSVTALDTGRTTAESRDGGIQNFSFENENGRERREPRIHFPGPPTTQQSVRRSSITSTDNTSDSSVYCPINPPAADVQRILDEKSSGLFERSKQCRHNQYDRAEENEEAVYTTVISEKKRDKARHKPKRRYISENRVGSLETSPVQSQREYSGDEGRSPNLERTYVNFERSNVEAFNPHNNYHRNKLLHQKTIYTDRDGLANQPSNEAINKEIIRALQPTEKSSDSGSIGSFLSMQSVKAFPKTTLPEPLNRVLEPVFVTYYDNVENVHHASSGKAARGHHKKRSQRDVLDATTIATIEGFPTPKAPQKVPRFASQSDNPDPGVVGPIVWERHKKRLSADDILDNEFEDGDATRNHRNFDYYSPSRDPAAMRNHYEGLLEGAIQMYSSQDDLPMPLPNRDFTNNRKPTKRELRGSSAGASNNNLKSQACDNRPSTAQPAKTTKSNHSTQPPSPTVGAWDGGSSHGSHQTLVRPMSAGPFHRPVEFQSQPTSSRHVQDLSTAPLIEAIQNELRKFQKESN